MPSTINLKQNDTRPAWVLTLWEPDPADETGETLRVVDLTDATSARLLALLNEDADPVTFASVVDVADPATAGAVVYVPIETDTETAGEGKYEVEVTWSDGGVETYPNDAYGTIIITKDLG